MSATGFSEEVRQPLRPRTDGGGGNHVGFGARAAVREVAKVYGIPAAEIKEVTRRMSYLDGSRADRGAHCSDIPNSGASRSTRPGRKSSSWRAAWSPCPAIFPSIAAASSWLRIGFPAMCRCSAAPRECRSSSGKRTRPKRRGWSKSTSWGTALLPSFAIPWPPSGRNTGEAIDYATFNPMDDPATQDLIAAGRHHGGLLRGIPGHASAAAKDAARGFRAPGDPFVHHPAGRQPIHPGIHPAAAREALRTPSIPAWETFCPKPTAFWFIRRMWSRWRWRWRGSAGRKADGLRKVISKKSSEQLHRLSPAVLRRVRPARRFRGGHRGRLGDVSLLCRVFLLQAPFGFLRPGELQVGLSQGAPSGRIHGGGHQQRRRILHAPWPTFPKRGAWESRCWGRMSMKATGPTGETAA